MHTFCCRACGLEGFPVQNVEQNHVDLTDERLFVGCDYCGVRSEVSITELRAGRLFEVLRLFPEDLVH